MKIRLSDVINKNCLQHGLEALEHFADFGKLSNRYPAVAEAVTDDVSRRGKDLAWGLDVARTYLSNKLQELSDAAQSALNGKTMSEILGTIKQLQARGDQLGQRVEELVARVAKAEGAQQ